MQRRAARRRLQRRAAGSRLGRIIIRTRTACHGTAGLERCQTARAVAPAGARARPDLASAVGSTWHRDAGRRPPADPRPTAWSGLRPRDPGKPYKGKTREYYSVYSPPWLACKQGPSQLARPGRRRGPMGQIGSALEGARVDKPLLRRMSSAQSAKAGWLPAMTVPALELSKNEKSADSTCRKLMHASRLWSLKTLPGDRAHATIPIPGDDVSENLKSPCFERR